VTKVSVILTTYNSERTISRTLDSILCQVGIGTSFDLELLVVDDCSTDRTTDILRSRGITYFPTEHNTGGPNAGRNMAMRESTGDYIAFIDHDDVWHRHKLTRQLDAADKAPIITCLHAVSRGSAPILDRHNSKTGAITRLAENTSFMNLLKRKHHGQNTYFSTIMIHRSLKDILFEENFGMVDFDWLLRLFHERASIQVNAPLVTRFVGEGNLSLHERYRRCDYHYSLYALESYEDTYPSAVAMGRRRINGTRARYYYVIGNMRKSRRYFTHSPLDVKSLMYFLTTFAGSAWVKQNFRVFG